MTTKASIYRKAHGYVKARAAERSTKIGAAIVSAAGAIAMSPVLMAQMNPQVALIIQLISVVGGSIGGAMVVMPEKK